MSTSVKSHLTTLSNASNPVSKIRARNPWRYTVRRRCSARGYTSQRIYQIMAGFEDADDCDRLCRDGILKMCAGRSASDEIDLASQPTMTRLENRLCPARNCSISERPSSMTSSLRITQSPIPSSLMQMTRMPTHMAHSSSRCSTPIMGNTAICPCYCSRGAAESSSFPSSDRVVATSQSTFQACSNN